MDLAARALPILERLVGFDTTSSRSNLPLIDWVEGYLAEAGVTARRIANADGTKANLLASIGPAVAGGVVLSGHTDVVPIDGQTWSSDPWTLTERDGRLYGRGSADMKGFIALALATVPDLVAAPLRRPVHLAFSYDEEIGCFGAPALIAAIVRDLPTPALVVIGEPSSMEVVSAHKGIGVWRVTVTGHEAHSSQTQLGVSAIMVAARLMAELTRIAEVLEASADPASLYTPPWPTLTIGAVSGGTAGNILAKSCSFQFDLRAPAELDRDATLASFWAMTRRVDAELKGRFPDCGVAVDQLADVPALKAEGGAAEAFVRRLAGDNGPARAVSFASEAGQFQQGGVPAVLCGPGAIDQAHQPDEYVEVSQVERGGAFMQRLVEALTG